MATEAVPQPVNESRESREALRKRLKRLESRGWWLLWASAAIMLALSGGMIFVALPTLLEEGWAFFELKFNLELALRGLVALVLLFNVYVIWQHFLINRLRGQLVEQVDQVARLEMQAAQWQQLAMIDPLTGLYNRRLAEERLHQEIARARRHKTALTVLLFDLNNFKQINDQHGHAAGDLVLKEFARHIKEGVRLTDIPVRMGGDEFMIILPECRSDHIQYLLSRLAGLEVAFGDKQLLVTFTAGWEGLQPEDSAEQLLERADRSLYTDKRTRHVEEKVREMQKMEAVGRLAGGVAHDFNNLLMLIKGYGELLLDRVGQDQNLRGYAEEIQKAADRAAALTRQLLAFSRRQVLEPKILDFNTVIADMDQMLRRLIGENIELVTRLAPDLARVKADRNQLEQVMMNLLINARDAMPQGGRLILETGNTEWDEAYCLQHRGARPGSYAMLAVSDTGVGMDAETRARIFEPFFTTKEKGKGTGLGLATVYGIVKQYGGYIWVYSEPGQGSTFKIYLPQVEAVGEAEALAEAAAGAPSGSETVLLVEDEEGVRKLSRQFLEQSGYTVLEASDPAAALWLAEQHPGRIDLLVTDVMMSQMGGREVAERLTQVRPEIKVLFVSGHTDDVVLRQGILDGGAAFLQKPFSRDALARKVREVLDTTPVH